MIGIICTMLNGFGARGMYNSQEIGLGKAVSQLTGQQVVIYKAVRKEDQQDVEVLENGDSCNGAVVTIKYIRCTRVGNAHGYMNTRWLDTEWQGEKMNALICFCDQQIFIPHISRFCRKNGIQMLLYTGIIRSNRGGINAVVSDILFRLGTKRLYRKLPVVAKTRGVADELTAIGAKNVPVAPVGMDFQSMHQNWRQEDRTQIRKNFGYGQEDTVVLCISRLEKEKNIMSLIPLIKKCQGRSRKLKFLVIGNGRQKEELMKAVADHSMQDIVTVIDSIPHDDIWKAYVAADYFVNLCTSEIFGMSIMESVYYETMAIAFHSYGPDTILEEMYGSAAVSSLDMMADILCESFPHKKTLQEDAVRIQKFTWYRTAKIMLDQLGIACSGKGKAVQGGRN